MTSSSSALHLSSLSFAVRFFGPSVSVFNKKREIYRERVSVHNLLSKKISNSTPNKGGRNSTPPPTKKKLTSPSVRLAAVSKYSRHVGSISLSLSLSVPRRVDNVYISFFFFFLRESAEKKRSKRSKTQKKKLRSKKYTIFIRSPQGRARALFSVSNEKASFGLYYY